MKKIDAVKVAPPKEDWKTDFTETHLEEKVERILSQKKNPLKRSRRDLEAVTQNLQENSAYAMAAYQARHKGDLTSAEHEAMANVGKANGRNHTGRRSFFFENNPLARN